MQPKQVFLSLDQWIATKTCQHSERKAAPVGRGQNSFFWRQCHARPWPYSPSFAIVDLQGHMEKGPRYVTWYHRNSLVLVQLGEFKSLKCRLTQTQYIAQVFSYKMEFLKILFQCIFFLLTQTVVFLGHIYYFMHMYRLTQLSHD